MDFKKLLPDIPRILGASLEKHYLKIKRSFLERKYEPSELNGAKFSEVVYRILEWYTSPNRSYTSLGKQIRDFNQSTRQFENKTQYPDSIRFHVPKMLNVLYSIRNKRGVGHVGGDLDPNHMDALFVVTTTDWILAELVRVFHEIPIQEAQDIIEAIIIRKLPLVWIVAGRKRILQQQITYKEKVLLLLYSEYPHPAMDRTLFEWTEHSNFAVFRRDILRQLHRDRLIEYDQTEKKIYLSPLGLERVEKDLIKSPLQ